MKSQNAEKYNLTDVYSHSNCNHRREREEEEEEEGGRTKAARSGRDKKKSFCNSALCVAVRALCSCNETAGCGTQLLEVISGLASHTHSRIKSQTLTDSCLHTYMQLAIQGPLPCLTTSCFNESL